MALIKIEPYIIDSTGDFTFDNVNATGNLSSLNANLGNLAQANFFTGTLTTNAQPNITSTGTLVGLTVSNSSATVNLSNTANVSLGTVANVHITGGSSGQYLQTDGSGTLSWATVSSGSTSNISNGNSNVNIPSANGNVNISSAGNANILVITGTGANVTGALDVTGNLSAANANLGNAVTANYFTGNFYGTANSAGTVTTAAQPNITSVGTLTGLTSNGVVNFANTSNTSLGAVANVHITGGSSSQYLQTDGTGNLTWASISTSSTLANGNSNVNIPSANGNVNISAVGNANILVITGTGANISGTANVTGNLSAGNANLGNAVTANYFTGNFYGTANSATTAGTVTTAAQPNITSVGTLTDLSVSNSATIGTASGSIDVANTTGFSTTWSTTQQAAAWTVSFWVYISSLTYQRSLFYNGSVSGQGITVYLGWNGVSTYTLQLENRDGGSGSNFTKTLASAISLNAWHFVTVSYNGTNTVYLGIDGDVSAVSGTALASTNTGLAFGKGTGTSPHVSTYGPQTYADVELTLGTANYTSNFTPPTTHPTSAGKTLLLLAKTSTTYLTNEVTGANVSVNGSPTYSSTNPIAPSGNLVVYVNANLGNAATANYFIGSGANLTNLPAGNISGQVANALVAGTVYTAAQPNITSVGTLTGLTSNGVVNFANTSNTTLGAVGNVHITGGSSGQYLQTDGSGTLTWATVSSGSISNISNGNSNVNIPSANGNVNISAVGNANVLVITGTGANITGSLDVTGNITAGNINAGSGTGGNISGGNVISANTFIASGNITAGNANLGNSVTANYFIGNGSLLTGIATANSATTSGTVTDNAQPNITSVGTLTSLTSTGNVSGGNLTTGGVVNATGNIVSNANVVTDLIVGRTSGVTISATGTNQNINLTPTGTGTVNVGNFIISNVQTPVADYDAATKKYVDDIAQGLNVHDAVAAATPDTLANITVGTITYNNGANGVGANLTTTGTFNLIDGVNVQTSGTRILVKNEANAVYNGIYTWSNATVITRATDYNSVPEVEAGDFVFCTGGSTYDNSGWVQTSTVTAIGTAGNNIEFTQFSGAGSYSAGTGLTLTGSVFSISNTTVTAGSYGNGDTVATFTVNGQGQLTAAANTSITANAANLTGTTLAGTVVNSSLTSLGSLTGLTVSNATGVVDFTTTANVTLGAVANLHIAGGSNTYVLSTDGAGNLSWTAPPAGANVTVDNFTGNGVQTVFTLSTTPTGINQTSVNYNGATVLRTDYSLTGANITFSSAPADGSLIEVTTINLTSGGGGGGTSSAAAVGYSLIFGG